MEEYAEYLTKTEPDINIVMVNLQELDYEELLDYRKLHAYAVEHCIKGRHNVLMIDEVQLCDSFEKAINSLHVKRIYDIYLTGSNAFLLSSDLATLFTGRTMEVQFFPFSFAEYREYLRRRTEKLYIQVSDNISDPSTFEREYSPLLEIKDAYPKMILARTRHENYDYQGIVVCDIAKWLSGA